MAKLLAASKTAPFAAVKALFALDLRGLAWFRIGLGIILASDVLLRARDFTAHYEDAGVLPTFPYADHLLPGPVLSLYFWGSSPVIHWGFLALTLVAACCVAAGFYTRLATVCAWLLLLSLQNRNLYILNEGDHLLRMLYFWAMLLPLNRYYAWDCRHAKADSERATTYFSGATVAYFLQIAVVYAASALLKTGTEWWPEGTAGYYALSYEVLSTSFGHWMLQWGSLLRFSTLAAYTLELAAPFLLLWPWQAAKIRVATIVALAGMHLSFAAMLRLGLFPWVDVLSLLVLLPGPCFDLLERAAPRRVSFAVTRRSDWFLSCLALASFAVVLSWNLASISRRSPPALVVQLATYLRLDQHWTMFAPSPPHDFGWFVIPGTLVDGTKVDVYHNLLTPPDEARPEQLGLAYDNTRWRIYQMKLVRPHSEELRFYYARWLCRRWQAAHADQPALETIAVNFIKVTTGLPGQAASEERTSLGQFSCQ